MNYTQKSIKNLTELLQIPPIGDAFTQDWIYEVPTEYRTKAYLQKYINAYSLFKLSSEEKYLLMELIIDIANDLLESEPMYFSNIWHKISELLSRDQALYRTLIDYWSLHDQEIDDCFSITPYFRKL